MNKKTKQIFWGVIIAAIAVIVVVALCFGCSNPQPSEPSDSTPDTPADVTPTPNDSTSDDASSDSQDSADFTSIIDDFSSQIDQKANALSSEYENAKFVNGESDAQLSQRASDSYDALKSLYESGKAKLQSEKAAHGGSDSAYNAAVSKLETNYNNSVQRLKDDIANLNS